MYGNAWPMTPTRAPPTSRIVYGRNGRSAQLSSVTLWATKSPAKSPFVLAIAEELLHAIDAVHELPVRREDVDTELVRDPHHVLATAPERGRRALDRVATVEQERAPIALLADPLDQGGEMRVAPHPPVPRGQHREIEIRAGIRLDGTRREVIRAKQLGAGQKRRPAALGADADDRVGLAIEHRPKRRVGVGDMEQGHVAERLESEEPVRAVGGFETRAARAQRPRRPRAA